MALLSVGFWFLAGCAVRPPEERPDVWLISVDTLRADHLGTYGYPRPTSPAIDLFAQNAVVFEEAFSQAPYTLASHASLFTSLLPQHHGAVRRQALSSSATTLSEVLLSAGYRTASFNGGGQVSSEFGLDQGFEEYRSLDRSEDRFRQIVKEALSWFAQNQEPRGGRSPTFLFLHTYEVHQPFAKDSDLSLFTTPEEASRNVQEILDRGWEPGAAPLSARDLALVTAHYDAEIRSMDSGFADFVSGLEALGAFENALVIVTSDHGEELGERGLAATHAHSLYDELLHVPLIVKLPGRGDLGGRRIEEPVSLLDVAPTILDVLGIEAPASFAGTSLLSVIEKGGQGRPIVSFRDTAIQRPESALRWQGWKMIGRRLFDLESDPGERVDRAAEERPKLRRMRALLREELSRREPLESSNAELSPDTRADLEALGYAN